MVDQEVPALALRDSSFSEINFDSDQEVLPQIFLSDVFSAKHCIKDYIRPTPLDTASSISADTGYDIHLKLENMQKSGSFKVRGILNKFCSLTIAEKNRGVIAASSGNHGIAVAYCGKAMNIATTIVVPSFTPPRRWETMKRYHATVITHGATMVEAEEYAKKLAAEQRMVYIESRDDINIIAGDGTVGLEILNSLPGVNAVVVPIGTGSLLCGVALAIKTLDPTVKVYGVQSEKGSAAYLSLKKQKLCRTHCKEDNELSEVINSIGRLTLKLIQDFVDDIVVVEEKEITRAMMLLMERCKVISEGAGATALAGVLSNKIPLQPNDKVAVMVTGGNVDMRLLNTVIDLGLINCERYVVLEVTGPDSPGFLNEVVEIVSSKQAQLYEVQVKRTEIGECTVVLRLELSGKPHKQLIADALQERGFSLRFK